MTDSTLWLEENSRYLSAALGWLRLLLERRAQNLTEPDAATEPLKGHQRTHGSDLLSSVRQAAEELTRLESDMQSVPALVLLKERFGLSSFEQNVLLLCAAAEFDVNMAALFARASGDGCRSYPTFALAFSIFEDAAWDALSPRRPLRYWRLIDVSQSGSQALTTSPLHADERIISYIKGLNYLDDRLGPYFTPMDLPAQDGELPASQLEMVERITSRWRQMNATGSLPAVQLLGSDRPSKQIVASEAAARAGHRLYRLPTEVLPQHSGDLELLVRLWQRESSLSPVALYLDAQESESSTATAATLRRFVSRSDSILFVAVRDALPSLGAESCIVDIEKPTVAEQCEEWARVIPNDVGTPGKLSAQFNLNCFDIQQIAANAELETDSGSVSMADKLWDSCRRRVRPLLDTLAQRLELKAEWADIVLPPEETNLLQQIAAQVKHRNKVYSDWGFARKMNRGLGITALFAGESGTGKTLAAEILANELRLNLYRIDLSAVVSKYIGETEKNLRRLFDAAEDGGAILFFDEADALFGKRSEVKDSHDRYANIEVNYLLQRMEAYRGLAILATNMRSALDIAFTRRLRFIVNFPFPNADDRSRMWQKIFPEQVPVEDLDYDRLARVNLNGGSIHNAAVNAAFLAAEKDSPINMGNVLTAIRNELIKMDRPVNESEFRWLQPSGSAA